MERKSDPSEEPPANTLIGVDNDVLDLTSMPNHVPKTLSDADDMPHVLELPMPKDIPKPSVSTPALLWGSVFVLGSVALRYTPKRPGLWRRRLLFGLGCGSCYLDDQHGRQGEDRMREVHRFDWSQENLKQTVNVSEKLASGCSILLIKDPESREQLRMLRLRVANVFLDARLVETGAIMDFATKKLLTAYLQEPNITFGETLWRLVDVLLPRGEKMKGYFKALVFVLRDIGHTQPEQQKKLHDLFRLSAYLSLMEDFEKWLRIGNQGTAVALISGLVGLYSRNRILLRLSLLTGGSSLGFCLLSDLAIHQALWAPFRRGQTEIFGRPLQLMLYAAKREAADGLVTEQRPPDNL